MFGPKHFLWRFNNQYQNLIDGIYSPIQFLRASVQFFIWFHLVSSSVFLWNVQAEKDWRQKEKGMAEDKMVRKHRRLNGIESEQTSGDREEERSLDAAVHQVSKSQKQLSDWITSTNKMVLVFKSKVFSVSQFSHSVMSDSVIPWTAAC